MGVYFWFVCLHFLVTFYLLTHCEFLNFYYEILKSLLLHNFSVLPFQLQFRLFTQREHPKNMYPPWLKAHNWLSLWDRLEDLVLGWIRSAPAVTFLKGFEIFTWKSAFILAFYHKYCNVFCFETLVLLKSCTESCITKK